MSSGRGASPDPRDVDAEFARMLEREGLELRPGAAPQEPVAPRRPDDEPGPDHAQDPLWTVSADSPPEPPTAESIARARAAHPAAGRPDPTTGIRGAAGPRELDDDEVLYGDFDEPDPELPTPSDAVIWSWTALLGGFVLLLVSAVTPSMPSLLGWLGGLCALGGVVALLLRAPRSPRDDSDDGAQV